MTPEILLEALEEGGYRREDPVTAPFSYDERNAQKRLDKERQGQAPATDAMPQDPGAPLAPLAPPAAPASTTEQP